MDPDTSLGQPPIVATPQAPPPTKKKTSSKSKSKTKSPTKEVGFYVPRTLYESFLNEVVLPMIQQIMLEARPPIGSMKHLHEAFCAEAKCQISFTMFREWLTTLKVETETTIHLKVPGIVDGPGTPHLAASMPLPRSLQPPTMGAMMGADNSQEFHDFENQPPMAAPAGPLGDPKFGGINTSFEG